MAAITDLKVRIRYDVKMSPELERLYSLLEEANDLFKHLSFIKETEVVKDEPAD